MPEHKFLPPYSGSRVDHVGTYQRVLPVSLERMFENALDWEHLPFLHGSSFSGIECEDAGPWGWRARVLDAQRRASLLELRLDTVQRRWITRTLTGEFAGAEIWTYVVERGPSQIEIVVDFHVPGLAPEVRERVGRAYARVYETLYDEDTAMMQARQALLDTRIEPVPKDLPPVCLGRMDALFFPLATRFAGRDVMVSSASGRLVVHLARCPHKGAPLMLGKVEANVIECPWHGYRFDLVSGDCQTGVGCSIAVPFTVWTTDDELWMGFRKKG